MHCGIPESFDCFTDAQWWAFWINALIAVGTLAAVIVAVVESVRAGQRTKRADRRAADSDAEAAALNEIQAQYAKASGAARKLRLEAEIAKNEHWLKVATEYGDRLRADELEAKLAELRAELGLLPDDDAAAG